MRTGVRVLVGEAEPLGGGGHQHHGSSADDLNAGDGVKFPYSLGIVPGFGNVAID